MIEEKIGQKKVNIQVYMTTFSILPLLFQTCSTVMLVPIITNIFTSRVI